MARGMFDMAEYVNHAFERHELVMLQRETRVRRSKWQVND